MIIIMLRFNIINFRRIKSIISLTNQENLSIKSAQESHKAAIKNKIRLTKKTSKSSITKMLMKIQKI